MAKKQPRYKSKAAQDFFEKYGDTAPERKDPGIESDSLRWTKYLVFGLNYAVFLMIAVVGIVMISTAPDLIADSGAGGGGGGSTESTIPTIYFVFGIIGAFALGGFITAIVLGQLGKRQQPQTN
ncbi:MAG: hypothetical protein FWE45_00455 [Firmicutes bacterium]|nr:hypothetical protein [Bacillota bacterium]